MTTYIGGPESAEQVSRRHNNYLRYWTDGTARMFVIVDDDRAVGSIGWWTTQWRDAPVHETGWFVLPEFQGRGFASAAVAEIVEDAREHGTEPLLTAFPSVETQRRIDCAKPPDSRCAVRQSSRSVGSHSP